MIGNCDACDRKNVPVSKVNVPGEPTACFLCQGEKDADPYCETGHDQDGKLVGDDVSGYSLTCSKCGAVLHSNEPAEGDQCLDCIIEPTPLEAARRLLVSAAVGSCTCHTKTPELMWHESSCRYVMIMTALENVELAAVKAQ